MTSARLVDSIANLLPSRISRRGFFARAAVAGSALAVSPVSYVLEPGTAYAATCNCRGQSCTCGSLCCDGGAQFCGGPRYYMDCNATCGGCGCGGNGVCPGGCSGTGCGCANGDCNNRAAGCNEFRYGNCHNEIPCLGPIVCRVVTCVAPWAIEPTCTTVPRVDQNTLFHDRPCLHSVVGNFELVSEDIGLRVQGWALDFDTQSPVTVHIYVDGAGPWITQANGYRPDLEGSYPGYGPYHGFDVQLGGGVEHTPHNVCVYALNTAYGGANISLGCRQYTPVYPFGAIDNLTVGIGTIRVAGWAIDPNGGQSSINVSVLVDGNATTVLANRSRPDLASAFPYGGAHGFEVDIPVSSGTHTVCGVAHNVGPGTDHLFGCRTIDVGTPFGVLDEAYPAPGGIRLRGWAIDPDTTGPIQVQAVVDGTTVATGTANVSRPDVGTAFPGFGNNHGFEFTVPIGPGLRNVCITLVNAGGGTNPTIACRTLQVFANDPVGFLDRATGGPGSVRVEGWVFDPDTANAAQVQILVDDVVVQTVTANQTRNDIGTAFPGWGAARGFSATVAAAAGVRRICARAINQLGGANRELGCTTVVVGGAPYGYVDVIAAAPDSVHVSGWAIDPDTASPISVRISVDGGPATTVVADDDRPDVATAFPLYGASHGFDTLVPVTPGAAHQICISAANVSAGADVVLACRTTQPPSGNPFGIIDSVTASSGSIRLRGWIIDPDVTGPVDVHVYMDGHGAAIARADAIRPDIATAFDGYGATHGFDFTMPAGAGVRSLCIWAINQGVGGNSLLGCRNVTVPA